jgi:hypothetical protein
VQVTANLIYSQVFIPQVFEKFEHLVGVSGRLDTALVMIPPNSLSSKDRRELVRCVRRHREEHGIMALLQGVSVSVA